MNDEPDIRNAKELSVMLKKADKSAGEQKMTEKWSYFKALCEEQDTIMATFWETVALLEDD